ncbi:helix-turn-helix domain-containing protein [Salinicola peritrichatus]|uniref:helix-turn-helix domain-containing protein n=1 Tax=Salinicola peritrichatus TaxID=1267424 RepID=UPI0019550700|nr:helix-turn-helix transcriptional regulator [Salinicola peritrichatus]
MTSPSMSLLEQIKRRRLFLDLTQQDMQARIGMTRQQYQRLERGGNPRLETLTLVAEGLNAELMLIPREKRLAVQRLLEGGTDEAGTPSADENPWHGLLDGDA